MAWILLRAKAKTAIAIPRRFEAGNLYESQMEIPGTTVRGAFAAAFLNSGKPADENFCRLFENPSIRFGPLRPLPRGIENLNKFIPVMPVPKSARSCKYDDGLPEEGHGVLDLLFEVLGKTEASEHREESCIKCGAPIEPLEKPWLIVDWKQNFGIDYKPDFRLNTHVGIGAVGTEEMGVAMEGRLFSLQCLPQGTNFSGWIAVGKDDPEILLKDLGFQKSGGEIWRLPFDLRVGRRSSTYGALEIEAKVSNETPWRQTHGNFEERWRKFQEGFWRRFISLEKLNLLSDDTSHFAKGYVFSVTFLTDTILLDLFLRPYRILIAEEVARRLGICESKVRLLATFTRSQIIRGWNTAHCLPKEQDLAIVAGSVFLFIVQRDAIEECKLMRKLQEWEEKGIGWRRSEGFGQVIICDPWHVHKSEDGFVPLRRMAADEEIQGTVEFDKRVVEFVRAIEEKKGKVDLTKTQLQNLKTLAHIIDIAYRHLPGGLEIHPCERLKQHLEHQKEKGRGWSQEIQWKDKKIKVADGLKEVLDLDSCNWSVALQRLEHFVQLMLTSIEGTKLDEQFVVSERLRGDVQ